MSTTTVVYSYRERLVGSFGRALFSIIVLLLACWFLWMNEGDFVMTREALKEAVQATCELEDVGRVRKDMNGQMVHASGQALANGKLRDEYFGFAAPFLALKRHVTYYQWVEKEREIREELPDGGERVTTTYSYYRSWVDSPVQSSEFHDLVAERLHNNTVLLTLENAAYYAGAATFGAYRLPEFLLSDLPADNFSGFSLTNAQKRAFAKRMNIDISKIHVEGNSVYLGNNPNSSEIGDVRVTFLGSPEGTISILARVSGGTFEPFVATNGKQVFAARSGTISTQEIYEERETSNVMLTWSCRLAGVFIVCLSIYYLLEPLRLLARPLPILGSLAKAGCILVSICLGLALSLLVIGIAWLHYRPTIGYSLLLFALVFIGLLSIRNKLSHAA